MYQKEEAQRCHRAAEQCNVCLHVYAHVYSALGAGRERDVREIQMVVAILWLLGTEPRSSGGASSAFDH